MKRSEEEKAFRRLKHIEWRLAYIERERRWIEKRIKWTNNPKVVVLISAISFVLGYFYFVAFSYYSDSGAHRLIDVSCMVILLLLFVPFTAFLWGTRENRDMRLTRLKRGMESLSKGLEREKEEICRKYPQLKLRDIKVLFPADIYRVLPVLLVVLLVIATSYLENYNTLFWRFFLAFELFIISSSLLDYLRLKQYGVSMYGRKRRKKKTPYMAFEREENYDIMQYKKF